MRDEPCHTGRRALQCGHCRSLLEADDTAADAAEDDHL